MSNNTKNSRLGRGLNSLLGGYSEEPAAEQQAAPKKSVSVEKNKEKPKQEKKFHAQAAKMDSQAEVAQPKVPDAARIWKIAVDKLQANENQPRQQFEEQKLKELSYSIKEQGILQPIVARKLAEGSYEIVSGERRWRAAQMAGLHDVPVILRNIDDKRSLELAIIENVQRADLNPVEEAEAYAQLQKEFGLTQEEIARRVGKERATVTNLLRLLQLHPNVRQRLMRGEISQGHAKVLLSLEGDLEQKRLAKQCYNKKWSVRQLEREVKKLKTPPKPSSEKEDLSKQLAESIAEDLQKKIGSKVQVDYSSGKGKISIYFYSDEQFTSITDKVKEAWS